MKRVECDRCGLNVATAEIFELADKSGGAPWSVAVLPFRTDEGHGRNRELCRDCMIEIIREGKRV